MARHPCYNSTEIERLLKDTTILPFFGLRHYTHFCCSLFHVHSARVPLLENPAPVYELFKLRSRPHNIPHIIVRRNAEEKEDSCDSQAIGGWLSRLKISIGVANRYVLGARGKLERLDVYIVATLADRRN